MQIQLVVFDWAGTTVDHGCYAPVAAFVEAFASQGVGVTPEEARGPMGLHKKDHIRAMLQDAEVSRRWQAAHGRGWTEADVESLFQAFVPKQMEVIDRHCDLIPGLLETVEELRRRGIKVGSTTGYFGDAARRTRELAAAQGYAPDVSLCPDDGVPQGRPAPWMIFRIMERLNVYPPSAVVKIGDTVPDIEEGKAAGVWSLGVTRTGSEVGLTAARWDAAPEGDRKRLTDAAAAKLSAAGADGVLGSVPEIIQWLDRTAG